MRRGALGEDVDDRLGFAGELRRAGRERVAGGRDDVTGRGDEIVVVAGVPFGKAGGTNSLRVAKVGRANG